MWYLSFAIKRLRARWQSLLTVIVGVLLAAVIGANASLYTDAIAGVGLQQYLNTQPVEEAHLYARTSFSPADVGDVTTAHDEYRARISAVRDEVFGGTAWSPRIIFGTETQSMFVLRDGAELAETRLRLAHYDEIDTHLRVVEGAFPGDDSVPTNSADPVPVAIHVSAAEALGIGIGDQLQIDQRGWESSQVFTVEIAALVREREPGAAYWLEPSPLRRVVASTTGYETTLLVARPAFEHIAATFIPEPNVQLSWRLLFPHEQFSVPRLDDISAQVEQFESALVERAETLHDEARVVIATELPHILGEYSGNIDLLNIPTGLILLQLGALVLFFLMVIAALVRRGERREIALLQSRGVYDRQVLVLRGIEALLICVLAALLAPFVARATLTLLLPVFTGIHDIPLPLRPGIFASAFGASLVALVVLVLTVRPVLRQPLILAGGSAARSAGQTWWQRYYVDVVLLVAGVVAFTQLSQERVLTTAADGTVQADPLLLLTPALLFIAFSSILLRFFPLLMTLIARAAARRDDLIAVLASWQVSREPLHYGRITFLLALAIGIGGFAVTYQATLLGNHDDQAQYRAGADVRVVYENNAPPIRMTALNESLEQRSDVAALSFANRLTLTNVATGLSTGVSARGRSRQTGVLLTVDRTTFPQVAYSRADLGTLTPPAFSEDIPPTGRALPPGTQAITLWVRLDAQAQVTFTTYTASLVNAPHLLTDVLRLQVRLRDTAGTIYRLPLLAEADALNAVQYVAEQLDRQSNPALQEGDLLAMQWPNDGWIRYRADWDPAEAPLPDTLYLEGILLTAEWSFTAPYEAAQIRLAGLQALDASDHASTLAWFQAQDWSFVNELFAIADAPTPAEIIPDGTQAGISLRWEETDERASFGLMLNYPELTSVVNSRSQGIALDDEEIVGIPVFVSQSFAEANALNVGQRFSLFFDQVRPWFEVVEVIEYYPTLYPETPAIVGSQDILAYTLLRRPQAQTLPGETWLRLAPDADPNAIVDTLRRPENTDLVDEIISAEEILQTYRADTLSLGIIGLLYLSFGIGIVLSAVSLFTYVSLSVQARLSEFAMLRALGLPPRRLLLMILLEQLLILVTALGLGVAIGFFLSTQVLPPLTISAAGGDITPPYIIRYDPGALLLFTLLIMLVMGAVLLLSAGHVQRRAGVQALRYEGE